MEASYVVHYGQRDVYGNFAFLGRIQEVDEICYTAGKTSAPYQQQLPWETLNASHKLYALNNTL